MQKENLHMSNNEIFKNCKILLRKIGLMIPPTVEIFGHSCISDKIRIYNRKNTKL